MHVVIPVGALHIGGGCRSLANLANALVLHGHSAEIVIPAGQPIEYKLNCAVRVVPALTKEYIPYGDIIVTNFYTAFAGAYEAWPNQCVRLCQGFEPLWVPDKEYALWTYQTGLPVICISNWLKEEVFKHTGITSRVVNLGINRRVFHPKGRKRQHHRKVVMYMARDPEHGYALKGFYDFYEAMKLARKMYRGKLAVDLVCSERPLPFRGVSHRIYRPENDKQMAHLYRRADVFVSSSWIEGFGLPPLEALASGTPVVTTNSGGVLDFCKDGQNSIVVPPRDPEKLAAAIVKVLSQKYLAQRFGRAGYQTGKQFTEGRTARRMVRALEQIYQERQ